MGIVLTKLPPQAVIVTRCSPSRVIRSMTVTPVPPLTEMVRSPPSICHLTQAAPITADLCHPFGQALGRCQDRSAFRVILEDPDEP